MSELGQILARRGRINEGEEASKPGTHGSIYAEFKELSIPEIKEYKKTFEKYDVDKSNFIDMMELKLMMEKLGAPQTHLGLKAMIKEVDEDMDNQISFREFLLIFRKAGTGELIADGLSVIAKSCNVAEEGVKGAKSFFEAKAAEVSKGARFEEEMKAEKEKKAKEAEEARLRKEAFKAKSSAFK
ncbi:EF-hand domain-containing protein D2-like [Oopsacas minuta]|uniref:EF-hand domain-containing protein D2-like n=1 Tax=Oopsacas minuta TaxID=111878 RepID=A0AAV7JUF9_9METZ|nr:EF-hand domain-containing protein D2-like [Oopsacas minuta]